MKDYEPFEIILDALMSKGYTEDEAAQLIIDLVEEHKQMDNIAEEIHRIYNEELNNPKNWN